MAATWTYNPLKIDSDWKGTPPPRTPGQELVGSVINRLSQEAEYWRQACAIRDEDVQALRAENRRLRWLLYDRRHPVRALPAPEIDSGLYGCEEVP